MNAGLWRTSEFVGGVITLAFGIWHTFVPTLYGWGNYMTSLPDELTRAIP